MGHHAQQRSHFDYADTAAACALMENEEFRQAVCASLQLLSSCFLFSPAREEGARALDALRSVDIAHDWPFGQDECLRAASELFDAGRACSAAEHAAEFQRLMVGPGHLDAPPWGSVYLEREKVTYGASWVELRSWMRAHGFESRYSEREPEDHFGRLLALAACVAGEKPDLFGELLGEHMLTWSDAYLTALREAARLQTYQALAELAGATLAGIRDTMGLRPAKRRIYR